MIDRYEHGLLAGLQGLTALTTLCIFYDRARQQCNAESFSLSLTYDLHHASSSNQSSPPPPP